MDENLKQSSLIKQIKEVLGELTDKGRGKNKQYEMQDAGMGGFAVFFTQSPSFLASQERLQKTKGQSNAESVFAIEKIPTDNQIRNLLDPVNPDELNPMYRKVIRELERTGNLEKMRSYSKQLLIAMDGTEYFSSTKIHCEKCSQRTLKNGSINYYHSALTPVIVQAGNHQVISLEPEFITPQDGHDKQDCEIEAGKRWIEKHGSAYAKMGVILLGDDLFCHQPFCKQIRQKKIHFILVCKPDSHEMLYETVKFLETNQSVSTFTERRWNGRHGEIDTYRYANDLPLNGERDALLVNWCELTTTHEDSGEIIYRNAFATDFEVLETNVKEIVRDGRARWKIENENNNVLKTKGYHLEHNFGHGSQYLASFLLSLNLLAFLFHTVLGLVDERYKLLRQALRKRQRFFQDIDTLLSYMVFKSWDDLMIFMLNGLELSLPPPN